MYFKKSLCLLGFASVLSLAAADILLDTAGKQVEATDFIPVKAGTLGTLALSGVFDVVKSAGITFSQGSNVFWNGQAAHDGALLGIAIQNATAESDHVRILLNSTANSQNQKSSGEDAQWQPL